MRRGARTDAGDARRARRGLALGVLALLGLAACGGDAGKPPERFVRLAPGTDSAPLAPVVAAWNALGGPCRYRLDEHAKGVWVDLDFEAEWSAKSARVWRSPRPAGYLGEEGDPGELAWADQVIALPTHGSVRPKADFEEGELELRSVAAESPPRAMRISFWAERGTHGRAVESRETHDRVEDGLVVWSGERLELERDLPAGGVLRYQPRLPPLSGQGEATVRQQAAGPAVPRVSTTPPRNA